MSNHPNTSLFIPVFSRYVSLAGILLLFSGCAVQGPVKDADKAEAQQLVWPQPPETPRIRYLGKLQTRSDVTGAEKLSMRDILLGKETSEEFMLNKPYGVHSDSNGRVFVTDTGGSGLVVFDIKNKSVDAWGRKGPGALVKPMGLTSDAEGNLYVSDPLVHKIVVFDRDGNYLKSLGGKEVTPKPVGLAFNDKSQRLYVVDSRKHQIIVLDPEGQVDFIIGKRGSDPGNFNFPTNIAIDAAGRLYVSDSMNFRLQVLEADGTHVRTIGKVGTGLGNFSRVKGVGVDTEGHIYAVDAAFNNFQIFDQEGTLVLFVGEAGSGMGEFYMPAGAHVDRNNRIFVTDQFNKRIQMFQYLGDSGDS